VTKVESPAGSVDSSAMNSFTVSRHSSYRVCQHSGVIDWPVSSASSRLVVVVVVVVVLQWCSG